MNSLYISKSVFFCICTVAASVVEFISLILWCVFFSFVFRFRDLYVSFRGLFCTIFQPLFRVWAYGDSDSDEVSTVQQSCTSDENVLSRGDLELVMHNLGLDLDPKDGLGMILSTFKESETSLELMKEAFNVFDKNHDGFIAANELNDVLNSLGLSEFSDEDCQRMILAMDCDGDGRIDFDEFVKVVDSCS